MFTLKTAAAAVFASLGLTREERDAAYQESITEMLESIKQATLSQLENMIIELEDFDITNWIVGDECGKALLIYRKQDTLLLANGGEMELAMKEGGEIWARMNLDEIYSDGFEPMFLVAKEPDLLTRLAEFVEETVKSYELTDLAIYFNGKNILKK